MTPGLSALLSPFPMERYAAEVRGRAPLHAPAGVRAPVGLDELDELVATTDLRSIDARHPPIRAVRPRNERVTASLADADGFADLGGVQAAFREGCTIVLSALDRRVPAVGAFCAGLVDGPPSPANLYWTPPFAQGFEPHSDPRDAFFLQLHGSKHWALRPPEGAPGRELVLRAGELLYVPRGWTHAGRATEEPSLHLTVSPDPWRAPEARPARDVVGWTRAVDAHTPVRRPPGAVVRVVRDASGVSVDRVAASLRCPGWAEPALGVALRGDPVTAAELPGADALQLVRRLVGEGLLEPVP